MAWQPANYIPTLARWGYDSSGVSQTQLTSTQTRLGVVFQIPRSGTVDKLAFRISSVAAAQDLSIGLYTVDSNGNPTTTNYGGSESAILPASQVTSGMKEVTLPTSAEATVGDIVAFVVGWASNAGDVYLRYQGYASAFPYFCRYASGTWTKDSATIIQAAMAYSDGSYALAGTPVVVDAVASFNINSSPNERGNLFQFPFGVRFRTVYFMTAQGGAYDIVVYVGNDTYSVSGYPHAPIVSYRGKSIIFPTLIEVPANTPFRIVVKPTTTTNVTDFRYEQFLNTGYKNLFFSDASMSSIVQMTTRTGGGTWTDYDTAFHVIGPVITEVETDVGGVGGFPFPPHVIIT